MTNDPRVIWSHRSSNKHNQSVVTASAIFSCTNTAFCLVCVMMMMTMLLLLKMMTMMTSDTATTTRQAISMLVRKVRLAPVTNGVLLFQFLCIGVFIRVFPSIWFTLSRIALAEVVLLLSYSRQLSISGSTTVLCGSLQSRLPGFSRWISSPETSS